MVEADDPSEFVFNHDGFGMLTELLETEMTEQDAVDILVKPLANSDISAIDWCILSTAEHNCRTRKGFAFDGVGIGRPIDATIGKVVAHYNQQSLDLLDIIKKHGHQYGLKVYGNLRLNQFVNPDALSDCPGKSIVGKKRKDFSDPEFQDYLLKLCEDIIEKGVDGLSLDFERQAPFFPKGTPQTKRISACIKFLQCVRELTNKPIIVRVSCQSEKGLPQGQDPEKWIDEDLVDIVIPATHNHEPNGLDWSFDRFLSAAQRSPSNCRIWPQIWPASSPWIQGDLELHSPQDIYHRVADVLAAGAHGVYFFNFCCFGSRSSYFEMFKSLN